MSKKTDRSPVRTRPLPRTRTEDEEDRVTELRLRLNSLRAQRVAAESDLMRLEKKISEAEAEFTSLGKFRAWTVGA